ncbi:hypothetical protein Tco_0972748 [Tanacetum coccineum]
MIGCKVMRTLSSVEIEIMLILGLPCCLSSSSVRCLEIDPYEAIRQAYLDGTDTESEPFEDPINTKTLESPLTVAPATSLPESTPPTLVPILRRTARMAVHVPPTMSSGLSACMNHYRGMSEFVDNSEEDDEEEDEEIEESLDSDSVSEDVEDEGPTVEDEDPAEGGGRTAVPGGQQEAAPVVRTAGFGSAPESERLERVSVARQPTLTTWTDPEDGMVYIDVPAYPPPAEPVQTPPLPEWTSSLLPISPSPYVVPLPVSSAMISLTIPSPVATPATAETEGFLTELGAQVEMQGGLILDHAIRLEELSSALFKRYDKDIRELFTRSGLLGMRFSPRGQTDAQRAALWHAISDIQGKNQDLRLQLAKERRARLELAKVVGSMRRGQEPRGDA